MSDTLPLERTFTPGVEYQTVGTEVLEAKYVGMPDGIGYELKITFTNGAVLRTTLSEKLAIRAGDTVAVEVSIGPRWPA